MARSHRAARAPLWLAVALALLAGCEQPQPAAPQAPASPPPQAAAPVKPAPVPPDKSLVFYESDVFDLDIAAALKGGPNKVHVTFAGPTSLNALPPRINVWLAEVKHSNGNVSVGGPEEETSTRAILGVGLIFDLIDAVNIMKARQEQADRLALVHPYDARVVYDAASGNVREVLFSRRPPDVPAAQ